MMVDTGLNSIRNLMSSGTFNPPTIGVVGSYAFTAAASDTALAGSVFGDTFDTNTVSNKTNEYTLVIGSNEANGNTLKGIGIYNSAGVMFAEDSFTSIQKTGSMEVQFDIDVVYANL